MNLTVWTLSGEFKQKKNLLRLLLNSGKFRFTSLQRPPTSRLWSVLLHFLVAPATLEVKMQSLSSWCYIMFDTVLDTVNSSGVFLLLKSRASLTSFSLCVISKLDFGPGPTQTLLYELCFQHLLDGTTRIVERIIQVFVDTNTLKQTRFLSLNWS